MAELKSRGVEAGVRAERGRHALPDDRPDLGPALGVPAAGVRLPAADPAAPVPTNAIESFHTQLRKVSKSRGSFPNDEAALKLLYLAVRNITAKWVNARHHWTAAPT